MTDTKETLEQKREKLGNLLGDGPEPRKTGIAGIDNALKEVLIEHGRPFTVLVLLMLRSKLGVEQQRRAGASEEQLDATAHIQTLMLTSIAKEVEIDAGEVIDMAEKLLQTSFVAVAAEREAGDPNGKIAEAQRALDSRLAQ